MFQRKIENSIFSEGLFLQRVKTPAAIIRLTHGSPQYSTSDLVDEFPDYFIGQLEIADTLNRPIQSPPLVKQSPKQTNILSARYIENGITSTSGNGLSVNLYSGRKNVLNSEFI